MVLIEEQATLSQGNVRQGNNGGTGGCGTNGHKCRFRWWRRCGGAGGTNSTNGQSGGAGLDVSQNWSITGSAVTYAGGWRIKTISGTAGSQLHTAGGAGGLLNNTGTNGTA